MNQNQQNNIKKNMSSETSVETKQQIEFQSPLPYPPVKCERKNSMYARIMLDNYAGTSSEMSTISFYLYNHIITDDCRDISNIFYRISIVEMHHLHIFGTLAHQLGADPRLWTPRNNQAVYWSPGFNQYFKQMPLLIEDSIKKEQTTIERYQKQINVIKDENIVENLKRIILDEELHVKIFEDYLKEHFY